MPHNFAVEEDMGKIGVHEFVSQDGVFEHPSWTAPYGFPDAMGRDVAALTDISSALLLGRRTYEMFAPAWSGRTAADDPGAPFFNDSPTYVASSTLTAVDEWQNSEILGPYDTKTIRNLKQQTDGDLYVSGSGTLVRALLADRLLDELQLFVFPVLMGTGARLYDEGTSRTSLTLVDHVAFDNGVLHLTYTPATRE